MMSTTDDQYIIYYIQTNLPIVDMISKWTLFQSNESIFWVQFVLWTVPG